MIVCCGEALIDMLPCDTKDAQPAFLPIAGGAIFNTAIALGRLGETASFVCGVSTDLFGKQLVQTLKDSGVGTDYLVRSDHPTTLAFVQLNEGQAKYTFYDENSAMRLVTTDDIPELPTTTRALQFGAISLISEPCGSAYEELMNRHRDDVVIALDPNIRPLFIRDDTSYRARLFRMIARSDIVKVSDEDLAWLVPDKSFDQISKEWFEIGVSVVLLTRGGNGAVAITPHHEVTVPAVKTVVVDTIGAGDTFNAGILASLNQSGQLSKNALRSLSAEHLKRALVLAATCASVTVSRAGANPPWARELT